MDEERDYELVGEDVGTDPAAYGAITAEEAGEKPDEPTEFGYKPGEGPEQEEE